MTKVEPTHFEVVLLPDTELVVVKMKEKKECDLLQLLMQSLPLECIPAILSFEFYHETTLLKFIDIELSCEEPCQVCDKADICRICLVNYLYDELRLVI